MGGSFKVGIYRLVGILSRPFGLFVGSLDVVWEPETVFTEVGEECGRERNNSGSKGCGFVPGWILALKHQRNCQGNLLGIPVWIGTIQDMLFFYRRKWKASEGLFHLDVGAVRPGHVSFLVFSRALSDVVLRQSYCELCDLSGIVFYVEKASTSTPFC